MKTIEKNCDYFSFLLAYQKWSSNYSCWNWHNPRKTNKNTALKMTIFKPTKLHETEFRHNVRIPTEDNELNN